MGRIVVQIACFQEEECLPATLAAIKKATAQYPDFLILDIDDGPTDGTVAAARDAGVDYVVRLARTITRHKASLQLDADMEAGFRLAALQDLME